MSEHEVLQEESTNTIEQDEFEVSSAERHKETLGDNVNLLPMGIPVGERRVRDFTWKPFLTAEIKEKLASATLKLNQALTTTRFLEATLLTVGDLCADSELIRSMTGIDREYAALVISKNIVRQSPIREFPTKCDSCGDDKLVMAVDLNSIEVVRYEDDPEIYINGGRYCFDLENAPLPADMPEELKRAFTWNATCQFPIGEMLENSEKFNKNPAEANNHLFADLLVKLNGNPVKYRDIVRTVPFEVSEAIQDQINEVTTKYGAIYPTEYTCGNCEEKAQVFMTAYHFFLKYKKAG